MDTVVSRVLLCVWLDLQMQNSWTQMADCVGTWLVHRDAGVHGDSALDAVLLSVLGDSADQCENGGVVLGWEGTLRVRKDAPVCCAVSSLSLVLMKAVLVGGVAGTVRLLTR